MTGSIFAELAGVLAAVTIAVLAGPAQLVAENYSRANSALMRGDAEEWSRMVPLSEDFVLFSPFGGEPSRYANYTPEKLQRMGQFFKNGNHQQEIVQSYASEDMIVLATVERANVEVGGLPAQDWALRVTSVFKRDGAQWKLAHRHADPFVEDVTVAEAARFARGERAAVTKRI